ncbi:MAG TPA: hypothetical protein PKL48_11805, partial [Thermodesulfobacteriota bacterium]|nr:hypothetical protein [Thermodesulfobacteriota bacterium]
MQKYVLVLMMAVVAVLYALTPSESAATVYTGSLSSSDGLIVTSAWGGAVLSWKVNDVSKPGFWTYEYNFTVPQKDIGHIILEASEPLTLDDLSAVMKGCDIGPRWY